MEDNAGGFYFYQTSFTVPSGVTSMSIKGRAASDPVNIPGSVLDFTAWKNFHYTVPATAGSTATLYFEIENRGIGGIPSDYTPTGFRAEFTPTQQTIPTSLVIADFNGDGLPDLAVGNAGTNTVSILLNNGAGSYGKPTNITVGKRSVVNSHRGLQWRWQAGSGGDQRRDGYHFRDAGQWRRYFSEGAHL